MDDRFIDLLQELPLEDDKAVIVVLEYVSSQNLENTSSEDDNLYFHALAKFYERLSWNLPTGDSTTMRLKKMLTTLGRLKVDAALGERDVRQSHSNGESFGYAFLDAADKELIHNLLNQIRSVIEQSPLSDRKKNELFSRISKLQKDIDLAGTATDRFMAFAADLAAVAGEMAENAKPAIEQFKDVLRIVMRQRAKDEGAKLPPPDEILGLELLEEDN